MAQSPRTDLPKREEKPFIRETISKSGKAEHPRSGFGWKLVITVVLAVVFGVTASLTSVVLRPRWEKLFGGEESAESLSLPQDENPTEAASEASEESGGIDETEASGDLESEMESIAESVLQSDEAGIEDYDAMYAALYEVIRTANSSLVTVTAHSTDQNWFDDEVSSDEETCGVIVALTDEEILILTDSYLLETYESVYVTFGSTGSGSAYLKAMDSESGIAVIAVSAEEVGNTVTDSVAVISLGNSYTVTQGQVVLAMGRPLDYSRSVSYGIVSYIDSSVQGTDSMLRLMQTNIVSGESPHGMLLNTDGELIGWLTSSYSDSSVDGLLCAVSISDLKPLIEKLINGESPARLGILGQNVTEDISLEHQIPEGVWITECLADGPAYLAGIQQGDILTAVGETTIGTLRGLQACLQEYEPGDTVTVTVQREGRDGYSAVTFSVTLDAR